MNIEKLSDNKNVQQAFHSLVVSYLEKAKYKDMFKQYFQTINFYPLVDNKIKDIYKKDLGAHISKAMMFGTLGDSPINIALYDAFEAKTDLFIQYAIEESINIVLGRKMGNPEEKDLKLLLKPLANTTFRDFYKRLVFVESRELLASLIAMGYEHSEDDSGVLAYGYVDTSAGLSLSVICCAGIKEDNSWHISTHKTDTMFAARYGSFNDAKVLNMLDTNADLSDYNYLVEIINNGYNPKNEAVEYMRRFEFLDEHRHPSHPDDIGVVLFGYGNGLEKVWVRCVGYNEKTKEMYGQLLNEPNQDFKTHRGNIIGFSYIADKNSNDSFCVHSEASEKSYNSEGM